MFVKGWDFFGDCEDVCLERDEFCEGDCEDGFFFFHSWTWVCKDRFFFFFPFMEMGL